MKKGLLFYGALVAVILALLALPLLGCTSKPSATAAPIVVWVTPTAGPPWVVAQQEGFFKELGINVEPRLTVEDAAPFLAGQSPISSVSSWEGGQYRIEKEDVMIYGVSGGVRFFNGIAVKASNYPKPYSSVPDLKGKKLGNPGLGTGSWAAFVALAKARWNIDATTAFQNVSTSSGAMLALVDKGELDGALLFSGATLAAVASGFPLVFSFDKEWEAFTGFPLMITVNIARADWVKKNPDTARKINQALDKAVTWMSQNTDQFNVGGRYEQLARDAGHLANADTIKLVQSWFKEKKYYSPSAAYSDGWVDSAQKFSELVLGKDAPAKADMFWSPAEANKK
ncbi:MAG: MqnA/MqnD/SBP family protein [Chloroflexota bacterium]|nr:MqnA/MqnD/SBP family protein [Chloroflexota bacterium]